MRCFRDDQAARSAPEYVSATTGCALPGDQGGAVRTQNGGHSRHGMASGHAAVLVHTKTRDRQADAAGRRSRQIWRTAQEWDLNRHWPSAAVRLPGLERAERPVDFTNVSPGPRRLAKDLVKNPVARWPRPRFVAARRTGPHTHR